jgi:hypothetical protein
MSLMRESVKGPAMKWALADFLLDMTFQVPFHYGYLLLKSE